MTWDDDDALITDMIRDGMDYLDYTAGAHLSYAEAGLPRQLLMDYVRYARSDSLEAFGANYNAELNRLYLMTPEEDSNEEDQDAY